jgi:hypothetical protein
MPTIHALHIEAMALNVPDTAHSNRVRFTGTLVPIDAVSDNAPHGTDGKKIRLLRSAAESALPTLLGMPVDLKPGLLDGHGQQKVGVISEARIENGAVVIAGHLWGQDFAADVQAIQKNKADLGFSFEATGISVESMAAPVLTITGLQFSGAAILYKASAAFGATSIAASALKEHVVVPSALFHALRNAGYERCDDPGDKLSVAQLSAILRNKSISERIALKQMADQAGIMPT